MLSLRTSDFFWKTNTAPTRCSTDTSSKLIFWSRASSAGAQDMFSQRRPCAGETIWLRKLEQSRKVISRYTFISDKGLWRKGWRIQNYVPQAIRDLMEKMWNWVRPSSFAHLTHLFLVLNITRRSTFFSFIPLIVCPLSIPIRVLHAESWCGCWWLAG